MKTFVQAMRDCNATELFGYLTWDLPPGLFEKHLKIYKKLYSHFLLYTGSKDEVQVALTGLASREGVPWEERYEFYGIINPNTKKSTVEKLYIADFLDVVENLWVPEILMEQTSEVFVVGELLRNLLPEGEGLNFCDELDLWDWIHDVKRRYSDQIYLVRKDEYQAKRAMWNQKFYNRHIRKVIVNEVQEHCECQNQVYTMGDFFYGGHSWYTEYAALCPHFPVDSGSAFAKIRGLSLIYEKVGWEIYKEVIESRERILIEPSAAPKDKPLVYVRNHLGEIFSLDEVDVEHLVCMDVRVLDQAVPNKDKAMALFLYHLLYSIRAEREHKAAMVNYFLKLKAAELGKENKEVEASCL